MLSGNECLQALYRRSGSAKPVIHYGWDIIPHRPQPKQHAFLNLECQEALYGGAGGGGKTDCLLMDGFRFVHIPGYSAIYFRRKLTDAALAGAIMDRAIEWFPREYWDARRSRFVFPCPGGGYSMVQFAYLSTDMDRYRYASAEFTRIYFDELTHFTELQYSFLFTRLRRVLGMPVPLAMRGATNPGGPGEEWVYKRFVKDDRKDPAIMFVSAKIVDNQFINREEYERTLEGADERTRRQIRDGEWMLPQTGRMYPFTEENYFDALPDGFEKDSPTYALGIDLGTSQSEANTTYQIAAIREHDRDIYLLKAFKHSGASITKIAETVASLFDQYDISAVVVDEGGLGKYVTEELSSRYGIGCEAAKKSDKLGMRRSLIGKIEDGSLRVHRTDCALLIKEANRLHWNDTGTDNVKGQRNHHTDAMLYVVRKLMPELAEPKKPVYAPGSKEYYAEAERRMLERDAQQQEKQHSDSHHIDDGWESDGFDHSPGSDIDDY